MTASPGPLLLRVGYRYRSPDAARSAFLAASACCVRAAASAEAQNWTRCCAALMACSSAFESTRRCSASWASASCSFSASIAGVLPSVALAYRGSVAAVPAATGTSASAAEPVRWA